METGGNTNRIHLAFSLAEEGSGGGGGGEGVCGGGQPLVRDIYKVGTA